MIRELGRSIGDAVFENLGRAASRVQERRPLPVDLLESDDAYLAVFDAPGATASDVQVRYVGDTVEVRIDRFRDFREGFDLRFPGRGLALDGEVVLPADARVDPEAATATLRADGTLAVRVPKRGADEDGEIAVEEADDHGDDHDDHGEHEEGADEHGDEGSFDIEGDDDHDDA